MALIRRITIVHRGPEGVRCEVLQGERRRKRKVSKWLRPLERMQRRQLAAQGAFTSELRRRQDRSSRKRRNGFLRDGFANHMRASIKAMKKLR